MICDFTIPDMEFLGQLDTTPTKKKKKIRGGPGTWPKRFFHKVHKLEASVIHPAISVMK